MMMRIMIVDTNQGSDHPEKFLSVERLGSGEGAWGILTFVASKRDDGRMMMTGARIFGEPPYPRSRWELPGHTWCK